MGWLVFYVYFKVIMGWSVSYVYFKVSMGGFKDGGSFFRVWERRGEKVGGLKSPKRALSPV